MATGLKAYDTVTGQQTDFDDLFQPRGETDKRPDVGFQCGGVDISNRYKASIGSDQIKFATNYYDAGGNDLKYLFQSLAYNAVTPPTIVGGNVLAASLAYNTGDLVVLTAIAAGTAPFTYEWRYNGAVIPGATTSSLNIASQPAFTGTYTIYVSNSAGTAIDSTYVTISDVPPVITGGNMGGASYTVSIGSVFVFSVTATGTSPTYAWYKDGVLIGGQVNNSYARNITGPSDAGTYMVVVSTSAGSASTSASLTVTGSPPAIYNDNLFNQQIAVGQTLVLYVNTTGYNVQYEWFINDQIVPGVTGSSINYTPSIQNSSTFRVRCYNIYGEVSKSALIAAVDVAPVIGSGGTVPGGPYNLTVGNVANFYVVMDAGTNLVYQWSKDGVNLPGGTASSYTFETTSTADTGNYTCTVSNGAGVASASAYMTVSDP